MIHKKIFRFLNVTIFMVLIMIAYWNCDPAYGEDVVKKDYSEFADLEQVYKFYEKNINGKTLVVDEKSSLIDDGKMETVFSQERYYHNLKRTSDKIKDYEFQGFTYDLKSRIKHTIYKLDENGNRIEPGENLDREFLLRYYFVKKLSTGQVIGSSVYLSEHGDVRNLGFLDGVRVIGLGENKLKMISNGFYYDDCFSAEAASGFYPCSVDSEWEFIVDKDGNAENIVTTLAKYRIIPATMERIKKEDGSDESSVYREIVDETEPRR